MTQPTLEEMKSWARQAGAILREGYGKKHQVDHKGVIDLVTEMDRRSETFLVEKIRSQFPEHRIVTEESGLLDGQKDHSWYVDPLDGTVNYAHDVPIFSVSIAYAEGGKSKLGVVYDPMRDELFSAEQGKGAWLNDSEQLHVSTPTELDNCLLVTGFPYDIRDRQDSIFHWYEYFARHTQGVRRFGSAALDLCFVAAGRLDGYYEPVLMPYDMAAGMLVAREAGALVTDIHGHELALRPPCSILAANPQIHPQLLTALKYVK
jgi:myo-inositol-1(or 4)-monophosphatase